MKNVEAMIEELIEVEGGYSNDPNDSGGETCWGITVAEARRHGYLGEMKDLPKETAKDIYRVKYWFGPKLDHVFALYPQVAVELFDTGVNCGVGKAGEFLQMCLNAFNKQGSLYPDIEEDGSIGNGTIKALTAYKNHRGEQGGRVLLTALNCLQGARYLDISRRRSKDEDFVYGWVLNRVQL